jgi:hypothetical protein
VKTRTPQHGEAQAGEGWGASGYRTDGQSPELELNSGAANENTGAVPSRAKDETNGAAPLTPF